MVLGVWVSASLGVRVCGACVYVYMIEGAGLWCCAYVHIHH